MLVRRSLRLGGATLVVLAMLIQTAWADTTLETSTTLSTSVAVPTEVTAGANSFTIRVWGTTGSIPTSKDGLVDIVTGYVMATNGAITPVPTSTVLRDFPNLTYNNNTDCPASGSIPQGCPANPFAVTATLTVAAGTPAGTTGTLAVSVLPRSSSGANPDTSPALGLVKVKVVNAEPTVSSISGSATVDEARQDGAYSVSATDPDGDTLTYAWSVVSGNATVDGAANASSVTLDFGDGPSSALAQVVVDDGHGHTVTRQMTIGVDNVAPTATFVATSPVDEGTAFGLSLTGADDVSATDDVAGFQYAFDCGNGYGAFSATSSTTCPTTDDGSRSVRGSVRDADGGTREYTSSVTIDNVAPSATYTSPSSVAEGGSFSLALTSPTDPSSDDVTAGFEHAFDCGAGLGYGAFSSTASASCTAGDDGSTTTKGSIRDKDLDAREYTASLTITNVAPTATFETPSPVDEGSSFSLSFTSPIDPSPADVAAGFEYAFDCGDGAGYGPFGTTPSTTCATTDDGTRTVKGSIKDKDGGSTEYTGSATIEGVAPTATFTAPEGVDEGTSIELSLTGAFDPSSDDTTAGFTYAFDCGDGAGYGAFGAASTASCATPDDGTRNVGGKVKDVDGLVSAYIDAVTVANVAPIATFNTPVSVGEGSPIALSLTAPSDPSTADTTAGFEYAFDCDDGSGFGAYSATSTVSCPTDDDGNRTVGARIRDDDGGESTATASVTIDNVAPTATFTAPASVDEGSSIVVSLTDPTDPSTADVAAGLEYAFDCDDGSGYGAYSATSTASCPTTDDGTRTVKGSIQDKDGGTTEYTASVTIGNVAPTATFTAPASVDEGSDIDLSLTSAFDPSTDDTTAGFTFAFGCAGTLGPFGALDAAACATTDSGTRSVKGSVRDKDGGTTEYTASVTVANVAPTATFNAPASVNEGSPIALSLTAPSDPSSDDTTAGFTYAFDCGAGYGAYSTTSSTTCPTTDDGNRTVGGKIRDKDGGTTEYTASVTVANVAPTITGFGVSQPSGAACATNQVTVAFGVLDPASQTDDPITGTITWGDGATTPISGRTHSVSHSYAPGGYSLSVAVADGDGGSATAGTASNVSLLYGSSGILQPINTDRSSSFKIGSTIPVKTRVVDCTGLAVGGQLLQVKLSAVSPSALSVNEVVSSSAADSGNTMRPDGQGYIFNLSTKRSQFTSGNDLTAGRYRLEIIGPTIATITAEFSAKS